MNKYKILEAEITRLLAENKELKEENEKINIKIDAYELYGDQHEVEYNQAFNQGAEAAWELTRKGMLMSSTDREAIFGSGYNAMYGVLMYHTYPEAAAKVAEWEKAKEKPQKTILMDLLEKLPNIETKVDGLPKFCPFALGYNVLCSSKKTCKECWNRPLEQIEEWEKVKTGEQE